MHTYLLRSDIWSVIRANSYPETSAPLRTASMYRSVQNALRAGYYGLVMASKSFAITDTRDAVTSERIDVIDHVFKIHQRAGKHVCHYICMFEQAYCMRNVSAKILLHIFENYCQDSNKVKACTTQSSIEATRKGLIKTVFRDKDLESAKRISKMLSEEGSHFHVIEGLKESSVHSNKNAIPIVSWYYETFSVAGDLFRDNYISACIHYALKEKDTNLLKWIDDEIPKPVKLSCLIHINPLATTLCLKEDFQLSEFAKRGEIDVIGKILCGYSYSNSDRSMLFVIEAISDGRLDILRTLIRMDKSKLSAIVCSIRNYAKKISSLQFYKLLVRLIRDESIREWLNKNMPLGYKSRTDLIVDLITDLELIKTVFSEAIMNEDYDTARILIKKDRNAILTEKDIVTSIDTWMRKKGSVRSANAIKFFCRYARHYLHNPNVDFNLTENRADDSWHEIKHTRTAETVLNLFIKNYGHNFLNIDAAAKKDNLDLIKSAFTDDVERLQKESYPTRLMNNSVVQKSGPEVFRFLMESRPTREGDGTCVEATSEDYNRARTVIWDYVNHMRSDQETGSLPPFTRIIGKYVDLNAVLKKLLEDS